MNKNALISELEKRNIGLKRFTVRHAPYHQPWAEAYDLVVEAITPVIGGARIFHIGSTAMPDAIAKPILDIGIAHSHTTDFSAETAGLESLGFTSKGEYGVTGRGFFTFYNEDETWDYIHIHAFEEGHPSLTAQLAFLRAHQADPGLVEKYNGLKAALVRSGISRKDYPAAKTDYINAVLAGAPSGS